MILIESAVKDNSHFRSKMRYLVSVIVKRPHFGEWVIKRNIGLFSGAEG